MMRPEHVSKLSLSLGAQIILEDILTGVSSKLTQQKETVSFSIKIKYSFSISPTDKLLASRYSMC